MARLLILSCSQRKRSDPGLLPAMERYDGPAFRILRKYVRSKDATPPRTCILSAEYGLLESEAEIPYYDRRMTGARATLLRPSIGRELDRIVTTSEPAIDEMFICASDPYLSALGVVSQNRNGSYVVGNVVADGNGDEGMLSIAWLAHGSIGKRMAALRDWLYGAPPTSLEINAQPETIVFRGVELSMTAQEVIKLASEAAAKDPAGAACFESWYVSVGEQRVAPKWLVQVLTEVPVGAFRTLDARRLLAQLGVEVKRV